MLLPAIVIPHVLTVLSIQLYRRPIVVIAPHLGRPLVS